MKRKIFLAMIAGLFTLTALLTACSDGDDSSDATASLLRKFSYNMTGNDTYYRVNEFLCTDNGDNTFEVKKNIIHYFSKTNANYRIRTGSELIDMVDTGAVSPSSIKEYTLKEDVNHSVNGWDDETYIYHLYKGLVYQVYYYF